ncbi:uncharacterized protein LOC127739231 [Mytilus californianus]|uniref:uncharacterized protein LOC127739231 n=1 Tax=Mytilus californianus TaxID=6549 RepID=UPI00224866B5|nr:uncharacterized protein LOC127739231 [Mytilus californianus]
MEEVKPEIRQDFLGLIPSSEWHKDKASEFRNENDKIIEVDEHENDNNDDSEWDEDYSEETEEQVSFHWDSEINSVSDWEGENIEGASDQFFNSCSDFSDHSDWDDSEVEEDEYYFYGETDEGSVKSILYHHEVAINKLLQCYRYATVKEEFEINAQEFLNIKIEHLQACFDKYMRPFLKEVVNIRMHHGLDRLLHLLCISRIFLKQDRDNHFRFLCSLAEDVLKFQSKEMLHINIKRYLDIQLLKNPLFTFEDLQTGISDSQFEHQLKLCYSKRMICKTHSNAIDQSTEENLKYFISTFDEVTQSREDQFETKQNIFNSLIHILDKFIVKKDTTNIKLTLEVLQKIIRNFVVVDCYTIFIKYMLRDRCSLRTKQQKQEMWLCSIPQKEDLLRSVCGFVIEFLQHLKLIGETLYTTIQVDTIFEENKCMYRSLIKILSYILTEVDLEIDEEREYELSLAEEDLIVHLDEEKETILSIYIDTFVDYSADKGIVNIIKEFSDVEEMTWENEEIILKAIRDIASIRYHKQRSDLAKIILDINLTQANGDLLIKITHTLWNLLKIREGKKQLNNIKTHKNTMRTKLQQIFAVSNFPAYQTDNTNDESVRERKTILYRCLCILRHAKKTGQLSDVDISNYLNAFNFDEQSLENEDQVGKKSDTEIMLIIMLLILIASTRHHKSAKLKKYLSQKYEYKEAILYKLWCSGDIHINPGPPLKKSQLLHDSQRERAWTQDMSSILLKLYKGEPPHSKPKNLWREKPEHWPSNKPFYDTKNHPHDEYGCFISDIDLLKCLIQCCDHRNVHIHNMYKKEIAAWTENKIQLLHKLHTFRTETEKIKTILQNFIIYRDTDELHQALDNIHVKLSLKVEEINIRNVPCKRLKNQTEIFADITRYLAAVVCKIIQGKDPESKCDGIWKTPPKQWPPNVPFFSPFNRGKCKHTCSDRLLVSTLLQHPKAVIPPKYKSLVETYENVVNATDKKESKKHKEVLCRVKTIQTDISVLDYALTYLHSEGFFTTEVYHPLHQWWSSQNVENQTEIKFANLHRISEERPKISLEVTRKYMTLSVNMDYPTKSQVCYSISFDDSLPTMLDSNNPYCSDIDQLRNGDNSQGTSVNKTSQIQQKSSSGVILLSGSNHGTDTTQYSSSNIDNKTDFSTLTESLFTRHKLLPAESNTLSLSELKKSKENTTSPKVRSISNREETLAKDSNGSNNPTSTTWINLHQTGQSDNNQRVIVPETNKSYELTTKQTRGQKRKYSNESNGNDVSKLKLMESNIKDDCVQKKTREEAVSDHQLDLLLESCIDDISFQHKSTSELSKNESSLGSAEDEIMDISLPVSSDYDEVNDGLEILLGDLINYESGKRSILEKELLLDIS